MANLKDIRSRISSVKSTRQITSAMKMVAAAKLRKAQDSIIQLRPYADKLQEVLSNLNINEDVYKDNIYAQPREAKKVLLVAITSNKGLCGGFNSNIIKNVVNLAKTKYAEHHKQGNLHIYSFGRKGNELLKFRGYPSTFSEIDIFEDLTFNNVSALASDLMEKFVSKEYDVIEVVYNQFKNAAVQILTTEQFLPVLPSKPEEKSEVGNTDFIFEPSKEFIVHQLIPKSLRIQFFRYILDSITSEHGARMTAMHLATENASDLIKDLTLQYNKARQAAITREIIEIVSGAEALNA